MPVAKVLKFMGPEAIISTYNLSETPTQMNIEVNE